MRTPVSFLLSMVFVIPQPAPAQQVLHAPPSLPTLMERWEWAVREAETRGIANGLWIGYSIERLMEEDSWIGSFQSFPGPGEVTLYELVTGRKIEFEDRPESDLKTARKALSKADRKKSGKKVMKELAFLFEFRGEPSDPDQMRAVRTTNITLSVDLDRLPLLWLGRVGVGQSVEFQKAMFTKVSSRRGGKKIIQAIGLHGNVPGVYEFLEGILKGPERSSLREESAFWLGMLDTVEALGLLREIALNEESRDVCEKAIFAISQMTMDAATETLIDLGRNAPDREVRKKAVFWLGQRASDRVLETLQEFVYDGGDEEIQKQAVFALTQLPNQEGVTHIIRIARTHPNTQVRKQAVFWLGQCDDPRAFETIVEIARGK